MTPWSRTKVRSRLLQYNKLFLVISFFFNLIRLSNHGGSGGRLIPPVSGKLTGGPVVSGQTVDSGFNQNQTELGVLILTVTLQMLAHLNRLLDKHVQILGNFGGKAIGFEDTNNLLSSYGTDLGNTIGITKDDSNLGRGESLLGELADMFLNVGRGDFKPAGWCALVRHGRFGDTLSWCMKTSHTEERTREDRVRIRLPHGV